MSGRSDILRHLEPTVRPFAVQRAAKAPRQGVEHSDFQTLIASAQGDIHRTNRPVTVPDDVELLPGDRVRLERAADAALAHDSRTALVLLDNRPLLLDVLTREVREEIRTDGNADRVVTDIDTLIVSRPEVTSDGEPSYSLMLRRLSSAAEPGTLSALLEREAPQTPERNADHTKD